MNWPNFFSISQKNLLINKKSGNHVCEDTWFPDFLSHLYSNSLVLLNLDRLKVLLDLPGGSFRGKGNYHDTDG